MEISSPYELSVKYKDKKYADSLEKNSANAIRMDELTVKLKEDDFFKLQF